MAGANGNLYAALAASVVQNDGSADRKGAAESLANAVQTNKETNEMQTAAFDKGAETLNEFIGGQDENGNYTGLMGIYRNEALDDFRESRENALNFAKNQQKADFQQKMNKITQSTGLTSLDDFDKFVNQNIKMLTTNQGQTTAAMSPEAIRYYIQNPDKLAVAKKNNQLNEAQLREIEKVTADGNIMSNIQEINGLRVMDNNINNDWLDNKYLNMAAERIVDPTNMVLRHSTKEDIYNILAANQRAGRNQSADTTDSSFNLSEVANQYAINNILSPKLLDTNAVGAGQNTQTTQQNTQQPKVVGGNNTPSTAPTPAPTKPSKTAEEIQKEFKETSSLTMGNPPTTMPEHLQDSISGQVAEGVANGNVLGAVAKQAQALNTNADGISLEQRIMDLNQMNENGSIYGESLLGTNFGGGFATQLQDGLVSGLNFGAYIAGGLWGTGTLFKIGGWGLNTARTTASKGVGGTVKNWGSNAKNTVYNFFGKGKTKGSVGKGGNNDDVVDAVANAVDIAGEAVVGLAVDAIFGDGGSERSNQEELINRENQAKEEVTKAQSNRDTAKAEFDKAQSARDSAEADLKKANDEYEKAKKAREKFYADNKLPKGGIPTLAHFAYDNTEKKAKEEKDKAEEKFKKADDDVKAKRAKFDKADSDLGKAKRNADDISKQRTDARDSMAKRAAGKDGTATRNELTDEFNANKEAAEAEIREQRAKIDAEFDEKLKSAKTDAERSAIETERNKRIAKMEWDTMSKHMPNVTAKAKSFSEQDDGTDNNKQDDKGKGSDKGDSTKKSKRSLTKSMKNHPWLTLGAVLVVSGAGKAAYDDPSIGGAAIATGKDIMGLNPRDQFAAGMRYYLSPTPNKNGQMNSWMPDFLARLVHGDGSNVKTSINAFADRPAGLAESTSERLHEMTIGSLNPEFVYFCATQDIKGIREYVNQHGLGNYNQEAISKMLDVCETVQRLYYLEQVALQEMEIANADSKYNLMFDNNNKDTNAKIAVLKEGLPEDAKKIIDQTVELSGGQLVESTAKASYLNQTTEGSAIAGENSKANVGTVSIFTQNVYSKITGEDPTKIAGTEVPNVSQSKDRNLDSIQEQQNKLFGIDLLRNNPAANAFAAIAIKNFDHNANSFEFLNFFFNDKTTKEIFHAYSVLAGLPEKNDSRELAQLEIQLLRHYGEKIAEWNDDKQRTPLKNKPGLNVNNSLAARATHTNKNIVRNSGLKGRIEGGTSIGDFTILPALSTGPGMPDAYTTLSKKLISAVNFKYDMQGKTDKQKMIHYSSIVN